MVLQPQNTQPQHFSGQPHQKAASQGQLLHMLGSADMKDTHTWISFKFYDSLRVITVYDCHTGIISTFRFNVWLQQFRFEFLVTTASDVYLFVYIVHKHTCITFLSFPTSKQPIDVVRHWLKGKKIRNTECSHFGSKFFCLPGGFCCVSYFCTHTAEFW